MTAQCRSIFTLQSHNVISDGVLRLLLLPFSRIPTPPLHLHNQTHREKKESPMELCSGSLPGAYITSNYAHLSRAQDTWLQLSTKRLSNVKQSYTRVNRQTNRLDV